MNENFPIRGIAVFVFAVAALALTGFISSGKDVAGLIRPIPNLQGLMQVGLSIVLTIASVFLILSKSYGPKDKHWAYATIGTILGFWLRGGVE